MIDDKRMLEYITETADMGRDSLSQVLSQSENNELNKVLRTQREEYERNFDEAKVLMEELNFDAKKANAMAKVNARVQSTMKTIASDNTTSTIAEMVIQGSTMGLTTMTKNFHEYNGENKEVATLAQKHIKTEQNNIEQMKKFL